MSWNKKTPIEGGVGGCICCGHQHAILPPDSIIAVGFGYATVTVDGLEVYSEQQAEAQDWSDFWTCADAEKVAANDPDRDWKIHLIAPLSERHYQRQGENHWVLYEKGQGFA